MRIQDTHKFEASRTREFRRVIAARQTRRVLVLTVGFALILTGLALIVLPGPFTLPLVFLGLTVLSWEFPAAKRLLYTVKTRVKQYASRKRSSDR